MGEHDLLDDILGQPDRPVAPSPAFAAALRGRIVSELTTGAVPMGDGPAMSSMAIPQARPAARQRPRRRWLTVLELAAVLLLMLGAVGGLLLTVRSGGDGPERFAGSVGSTPVAASGASAMWGGDAGNTQVQPGAGPRGEITVAWENETGDEDTHAYGAIALGNRIYHFASTYEEPNFVERVVRGVLSRPALPKESLVSIDAVSGETAWRVPLEGWSNGIAATAERVYLIVDPSGDAPAELRALDATTGAEVWSREVGDLAEWFAPVKIADGALYAVRSNGAIAAFDAATGEERWSTTVAASGTAAGVIPLDANGDPLVVLGDVAIADGQLIVPVGVGEVVALDAATGRERWRFDAGERYGRTPVAILPAANGDAIALNILSDDRAGQPPIGGESKPQTVTVAVVEAVTGAERWARSLTGDFAPLGLTGDTVAVALGPRVATELIGLDVATGETRWESTTSDEYVTFSLGGAGDDRLYLTDAGALRALDTTTGEEVWRVEVGTGTYLPPAITDGVVVVLNDRGVIGVTGSERLADPTSAEVARPDAAPSDQPATPESADSAQPTGR